MCCASDVGLGMMRDGSDGEKELEEVDTQGVSVDWKVVGSACSGPGGRETSSSGVEGDVEALSEGSRIVAASWWEVSAGV